MRQTCARTLLFLPLHYHFFYTQQRQKDDLTFKDQIWTNHWGVGRATCWRLWVSLTGWPSSQFETPHEACDPHVKSAAQHLWLWSDDDDDPCISAHSLPSVPAVLSFFIHSIIMFYIYIAWILKPTSVLFLHPLDGFYIEWSVLLLYWTSFEWQNTVTLTIQARTLCLPACWFAFPRSYYIY